MRLTGVVVGGGGELAILYFNLNSALLWVTRSVRVACDKRVACMVLRTVADGHVVDGLAVSTDSASTATRVQAPIVDAWLFCWAVAVYHTLGSAAHIGVTEHAGSTDACHHVVAVVTLSVGAALRALTWVWFIYSIWENQVIMSIL